MAEHWSCPLTFKPHRFVTLYSLNCNGQSGGSLGTACGQFQTPASTKSIIIPCHSQTNHGLLKAHRMYLHDLSVTICTVVIPTKSKPKTEKTDRVPNSNIMGKKKVYHHHHHNITSLSVWACVVPAWGILSSIRASEILWRGARIEEMRFILSWLNTCATSSPPPTHTRMVPLVPGPIKGIIQLEWRVACY
jgi:hypothetical protein